MIPSTETLPITLARINVLLDEELSYAQLSFVEDHLHALLIKTLEKKLGAVKNG